MDSTKSFTYYYRFVDIVEHAPDKTDEVEIIEMEPPLLSTRLTSWAIAATFFAPIIIIILLFVFDVI